MRVRAKPTDKESAFRLEELFFSTTDRKGVIRNGNEVFVRVSGFANEDLVGAPHNIVRHPDMPRAVFRVAWTSILAGKPVAAYVKNMSKDGSYYWVLAFFMPLKDGFLSIRMKPSTALLPTVSGLYKTMLETEEKALASGKAPAAAMDASTEVLTQALQQLGFADYEKYMHELVVSEYLARRKSVPATGACENGSAMQQACGRIAQEVEGLFGTVSGFLSLEKSLAESVTFAQGFGHGLHIMTLNAQVRAAALKEDGMALAAVAGQMSQTARAVRTAADQLGAAMSASGESLKRTAFEIVAAELAVEMAAVFLAELSKSSAEKGDTGGRIAELAGVVEERLATASRLTRKAGDELERLHQQLGNFQRQMWTLDILQVTGRVETARSANAEGFVHTLSQLADTTKRARAHTTHLAQLMEQVSVKGLDEDGLREHLATLAAA